MRGRETRVVATTLREPVPDVERVRREQITWANRARRFAQRGRVRRRHAA
jgi:hypothetical protein